MLVVAAPLITAQLAANVQTLQLQLHLRTPELQTSNSLTADDK